MESLQSQCKHSITGYYCGTINVLGLFSFQRSLSVMKNVIEIFSSSCGAVEIEFALYLITSFSLQVHAIK